MTPWAEPRGISSGIPPSQGHYDAVHQEDVRFVVVEQKPGHSICLRISTYGGQGTMKHGVVAADHAAIVAAGTPPWLYEQNTHGENLTRHPIEVKVETSDPAHAISPKARVNLTKPYTVEHNIYIQNIGRVVGQDSLQRLKEYYAEGTGHVVNPTSYGTYANAYGSGNSANTSPYYYGAQF
jgi:hypothetical protein